MQTKTSNNSWGLIQRASSQFTRLLQSDMVGSRALSARNQPRPFTSSVACDRTEVLGPFSSREPDGFLVALLLGGVGGWGLGGLGGES